MNKNRVLTPAGAKLIQHFEGCLKEHDGNYKAYKCPAGVWTIGWGSTHHGGHKIDATTKWTRAQCDKAFISDMASFERDVRHFVTVPLTDYQFDALVSFTYNVGAGNLAKSTLLKRVNNKEFEAAAKEFLKWDKANGKTLAGLTRRRASESLLFQGQKDANYDGKVDPAPPVHPMPQTADDPGDGP
jgi:lysozyme